MKKTTLKALLLGILEEITQHAFDAETKIEDIKADFDRMRDLAYLAITKLEKGNNGNPKKT